MQGQGKKAVGKMNDEDIRTASQAAAEVLERSERQAEKAKLLAADVRRDV